MAPPSHRSLHLHIDRRRMVILGVAGAFLVIAIVFGALAYFQTVPTPGGSTSISVPVTTAVTVAPPAASSPASGASPASSPVVTITATRTVSVPQASAGSSLGAIESGASTLSTVVAAACAVIALRPHRRDRPPAPAGAPVGTSGAP